MNATREPTPTPVTTPVTSGTHAPTALPTAAPAPTTREILNRVLDDCERTLPDNLRLSRRLWPNLPAAVVLAPADLARVVGDTVRQAIDALSDGGEIIVMAHPTEVRTGAGTGLAPGRYLLITVQSSALAFAFPPEPPLTVPASVHLAWRAARDGRDAGVCLQVQVA